MKTSLYFFVLSIILSACHSISESEKNTLARYYLENNDPLAAIVECNEGIAKLKQADSLYYYRAIGFGWIKKNEKGISDWNYFLSHHPDCDTCRLALGSLLIKSGDTTGALQEFSKVVSASKTLSAKAMIERAMLYFHQKKWQKSLAELHLAKQKANTYFLPYYYLGFYYSQYAGADTTLPLEKRIYPCLNTDSALHYFNVSIRLNPEFADNYYRKGLVFENLFILDSAAFYYQKALSLDSLKSYEQQLILVKEKIQSIR
jgi:tetratricopeptide (TPR) repeat protein